MKCIDIYIFQVGQHELYPFRYMEKAYQYGIKGFVFKQGKDIFIEAEGEDKYVESYADWCRGSQFQIKVDDYVEIEEVGLKNYTSFEIIMNEEGLPYSLRFIEKKEN